LSSKRHYTDRAVYMRRLAREALTEALRKSCLKQAEEYEALAMDLEKADAEERD
jgi:hypothetical protein